MADITEILQILPKGIVENTSEIYDEVASFDVVPPEKLKHYWSVYTTTHRRLYDPTASRLESFWWHVWGSDRRHLSGETLAKLYENISTGPTFVPMRGPPNRYEGPVPAFLMPVQLMAALQEAGRAGIQSSGTQDRPVPAEEAHGREPDTNGEEGSSRKTLPLSARPPPQSILKKPRPSVHGPRLTPHFALDEAPAENAKETAPESVIGSADADSHRARTPRPDSRKGKPKLGKKKVVVSSSLKRKAVVYKRSNSHSSVGSASSEPSLEQAFLSSSRHSGQTLIEEIAEAEEGEEIGGAEDTARSPEGAPQISAKAAGKKPMPPRSLRRQLDISSPASSGSPGSVAGLISAAPRGQRPVLVHQRSKMSAVSGSPESPSVSGVLEMPAAAPRRRRLSSQTTLETNRQHALPRTASQRRIYGSVSEDATFGGLAMTSPPLSEASPLRLSRSLSQDSHAHGMGAPAVIAPSMVAARGVFLETEGPDPLELYAQNGLGDGLEPTRERSYSQYSLGPRQFTPTRPTPTPRIPFARTRSQLNIILDREKERLGEGNYASWRESRNREQSDRPTNSTIHS